jgi:hypothetical protein
MKTLDETKDNISGNVPTDAFVAYQAAHLIKEHAEHVSMATASRLAQSRQMAVNRLASLQEATAISQSGSVLHWLGDNVTPYLMQHRAMSAAFAIMLVTFFAVQQFGLNDNLEHSDAYLLASDLPPEAFADKGFDTWLVSARN